MECFYATVFNYRVLTLSLQKETSRNMENHKDLLSLYFIVDFCVKAVRKEIGFCLLGLINIDAIPE